MTRTLAHSLSSLAKEHHWEFKLWSAYDSDKAIISKYLTPSNFRGFAANRALLVLETIRTAAKNDIIIISHINLAIIGVIVKTINPKCKIWLIAHGIEVWRPLSALKKMFLKQCDKIICVSNFTREQMMARHQIDLANSAVLNNAVDPFMKLPENFVKPAELMKRYRVSPGKPVIFTLSRLAATEQYKGHDQVIKVMGRLKNKFPGIRYILAGEYDNKEEIRIQKLITQHKVDEEVILTGFIDEAKLADYFLLADLFVLPSKKEGFGIVFIEALACGLPVICGNSDGSIDAICNGELGTPINTDNLDELEDAITKHLKRPLTSEDRQDLQRRCLFYFNEADYRNKLYDLISTE